MIASANFHTEVVEQSIFLKIVDIDFQMKDGSTGLMLACYYGHVVYIAECLLQSHAD